MWFNHVVVLLICEIYCMNINTEKRFIIFHLKSFVFLDVPSAISHLVHNLPPLPSCELTDPHDDITLPRLIEALRNRHMIKQMMIEEYSKAGTCSHFSSTPISCL